MSCTSFAALASAESLSRRAALPGRRALGGAGHGGPHAALQRRGGSRPPAGLQDDEEEDGHGVRAPTMRGSRAAWARVVGQCCTPLCDAFIAPLAFDALVEVRLH